MPSGLLSKASYDGIKSLNKTRKLAYALASSWPLRDRLLLQQRCSFIPLDWLVTLDENARWRHFSERSNSKTLWVYRTPGILRFTSLTTTTPLLFFPLPTRNGFSEVNRYVSRHCSWKDERAVPMFWTRAKVLSVCYSSKHRSRQRCLFRV